MTYLINEPGFSALKDKLITPEQAAQLPSCVSISILLSKNGVRALREKIITVEQAISMNALLFSRLIPSYPRTE